MESKCNHPLNVQLPLNLKEVVSKRLKKQKVVQNQICVICGLEREFEESLGAVIKIYDEDLKMTHLSIDEYIGSLKNDFVKYKEEYNNDNNKCQLSDFSLAHKYIRRPEFFEGKEIQLTRSKK